MAVEVRPSRPKQFPVLWDHYSLYHPPERVVLQEAREVKFSNRERAVKALKIAISLIPNLNQEDQDKEFLAVASLQAEIGEDFAASLSAGLELIKEDRIGITSHHWVKAAEIMAFAGNIDKAFEFADVASKRHEFGTVEAWPFVYTAAVLDAKGLDSAIFIDKAIERQEQRVKRRRNSLDAISCAELAIALEKQRRNPEPWLRKAKEILDGLGPNDSWGYAHLADAYAHFGKFDEAKLFAEKVQVEEGHSPSREDALVWIARRQAEQGFIDDAMETARSSGSPKAMVDLLLEKAYLEAKQGKDPEDTLAKAIEESSKIKPDPRSVLRKSTAYGISLVYSDAGRISAKAGKDPKPMFEQALKHAELIEDEEQRVKAYKKISIDLFYAGGDSVFIIENALNIESKEKSPVMLQEILEAALECGYYEYVDVIMQRIEDYRSLHDPKSKNIFEHTWSQNIDAWEINFLLMQAKIFGERSVSHRDIIFYGNAEEVRALINRRN